MENESTAAVDAAAAADESTRARSKLFTPTARQWGAMILLSTAICVGAILLGTYKIELGSAAIVLMPILWAVLMGAVIGVQRLKPLSGQSRAVSSVLLDISIVLFLAALGVNVGPALSELTDIGPAILLQEVGHIFGTVLLALPVAVGLGLGRVAIGATWAIDRESYLAYALQKFGVKSPIYRGVFSVWLLGSVFGAVFVSLLAGVLGGTGFFDPRSLALGLGLGSGSMMMGGVAALSIIYPESAGEILALAALSNLVTNLVGFYAGVFLSLPLAQRLYKFWAKVFGRDDEGRRIKGRKADAARQRDRDVDVSAVVVDPEVRMKPRIWVFAFGVSLAVGLLLNFVGTRTFRWADVAGILVLGGLTAVAFLLARKFRSVPPSVWVLALATLVSAPFMPTAPAVVAATGHLDALFVGLASIALLGLNLGRDVKALKTLNWKIVIVAMVTFSSTFIAAVLLAETVINL
ncbi:DUF3100 domain-containing protein [Zhihengliuella salsuginis]|uniref:DUF3100 domain-containing protein n=1 Tax=Zhihengliuella salsuginis TaxID=578222 RepID=A0ABQ3GEQ9_9MICC|nr:DUF3100 domain-containing protein [Zhihengliuella salsuginis]GHD03308.1 hypothetical protein GCM10008096_09420 [Zhihengliuella salsuginis]